MVVRRPSLFLLGMIFIVIFGYLYLETKTIYNQSIAFSMQKVVSIKAVHSYRSHQEIYTYEGYVFSLPLGEEIVRSGETYRLEGFATSLAFDWNLTYDNYLRSQGQFYRVKPVKLKAIAASRGISRIMLRQKEWLSERINRQFHSFSGIIKALLYGDRNDFPRDLKEILQMNGTYHLFAISGFHMGIFVLALSAILKKIRSISYHQRVCITGLITIYYVFFTGARPSTLRACFFLLILALAEYFEGKVDLLSSTSCFASISLLINPWIIFDAGFILSISAVLGIAIIYQPLVLLLQSRLPMSPLLRFILLTTSISVFTLPISALCFGTFNPWGILINFLSIPLMSLLFPILLISLLLFSFPWIGGYITSIAAFILKLFLFVNEYLYRLLLLGQAKGSVSKYIAALWIIFITLIFVSYEVHQIRKYRNDEF